MSWWKDLSWRETNFPFHLRRQKPSLLVSSVSLLPPSHPPSLPVLPPALRIFSFNFFHLNFMIFGDVGSSSSSSSVSMSFSTLTTKQHRIRHFLA
jgi:hypothetical protein